MNAPTDSQTGSAVLDAALSRLHDYLRRAQPVDEVEAMIARDAFCEGFKYGARWGVHTTGRLANPEFREAINVLAELVGDGEA